MICFVGERYMNPSKSRCPVAILNFAQAKMQIKSRLVYQNEFAFIGMCFFQEEIGDFMKIQI